MATMRNLFSALGTRCSGVTPVLVLFLAAGVGAQETPGQPDSTSGAVIKGKAPVARELLKVRFPRPKTFTLKNGLSVYVLEDHRLPAVRFSLIMRAGSLFEPKPAVADLTAAMLTEGTSARDYKQLAETTEDIGASLNANAGDDTATISVAGLTESTDTLVDVLRDVLLHPSFPADRLARVKYQQTSRMGQRRTNPASLTADLSARIFYGGTPYDRPEPSSEQVSAVTRDDLVAFHSAYYRPNGAIMGVTGDVSTDSLKAKLETALADWQPAERTAELPEAKLAPRDSTRVFLIDRPGSAQTVLTFGNLAVKRGDPDEIALVVANRILGGGSSGRLFQNIRERKGYTYGAYSTLSAPRWPGIWGASASVRTPVTAPACAEFFHEFDRLQDEPVPSNELEEAKRSIIGSFARTLESPEGILARTLEIVRNGLPRDYWDTYPARIEAVTAEDVQRVARKYLGKGRIQVIAVGERSKIEDGLKAFGPIEVVDVDKLVGAAHAGK